jgi:hypothetical protein
MSIYKIPNLDRDHLLFTKFNPKLLEESTEENLCGLCLWWVFRYNTKRTTHEAKKILLDLLDFVRIENTGSVKDTVKRIKSKATDWEKIFAITNLIKDLYIKCTKNP